MSAPSGRSSTSGSGLPGREVTVVGEIPEHQVEEARRRFAELQQFTDDPLLAARLTLRAGGHRAKPARFVADASVLVAERLLAAHASGPSPVAAVEAVVDRLRRQLRRVVGADVALRNEPRTIERALSDLPLEPAHLPELDLKPPEERQIVHRRTYAPGPEPTLSAIADMLDDDEVFHLFVHARTNEDVVVHRRDDGRIGLIFPPGSILEDERDIVVPEPSWFRDPIPLEAARSELDAGVRLRWVYFIDEADGRGKVLYLRHDGDYGLVEPE